MKFSAATVAAISALAGLATAVPTKVLEERQFPSFPGVPRPTSTCRFVIFCPRPTSTPAPPTPTGPAPTGGPAPPPGGDGPPSSYNGGSTANDVKQNTGCRPITVIFARGTSEGGNVGSVAGPPMFNALHQAIGKGGASIQGVDYPASAGGNANQGGDGGPEMARLVAATKSACPSSRIILSGYSQGAMVVHNALERQGVNSADIAGAVLFGDPLLRRGSVGSLPANKVKQFCASGDAVCEGGGFGITPAHLSYGKNAGEAASFITSVTGVN